MPDLSPGGAGPGILARSSRGMVTSPYLPASQAGRAVLRRGGTAVEAAVAMGAVLAVAYPHFCGLGGDAVWLLADGAGRREVLLGIGQAVAARPRGAIPARGPGSALTTACLVDSWAAALDVSAVRWGGRERLADLLEPAIALAEEGLEVTPSQRFWLDYRRDEARDWPGFAAVFGRREGRMRQPGLAASLRAIADEGPRSFYDGALARRIARGLVAAGAPVTEADLAATRTRTAAPVAMDWRGLTLLAPPPPTQGVTTLAIVGILEALGLNGVAEGSAEFHHLLVEAVKQAFLDREGIADPDIAAQPVARWLDPYHLAARAAAVRRDRAMPWQRPHVAGDTVFLGAVDAAGRCASVLQSLYFDWGSGVVAGETGILWQNRGAAFGPEGSGPRGFRPGARPFYTLNPGIALRDGRPHLVYGTQGADGQPQTLALLLARAVAYGMAPDAALAAPRFLLGRTFSDSRDTLKLEASAGEDVAAGLRARGHELAALPAGSPIFGQAGMIVIRPDAVAGAHDPRSDGAALAEAPLAG